MKTAGGYIALLLTGLSVALLLSSVASADLIALYRFDDSTANDVPGENKIGAHKGETFNGVNVTNVRFVTDTPNKSMRAASLDGKSFFDHALSPAELAKVRAGDFSAYVTGLAGTRVALSPAPESKLKLGLAGVGGKIFDSCRKKLYVHVILVRIGFSYIETNRKTAWRARKK